MHSIVCELHHYAIPRGWSGSSLHNIICIPRGGVRFCVCVLTLEIIIAARELWRAHRSPCYYYYYFQITYIARATRVHSEVRYIEGGTTRVTTAAAAFWFSSHMSRFAVHGWYCTSVGEGEGTGNERRGGTGEPEMATRDVKNRRERPRSLQYNILTWVRQIGRRPLASSGETLKRDYQRLTDTYARGIWFRTRNDARMVLNNIWFYCAVSKWKLIFFDFYDFSRVNIYISGRTIAHKIVS